MSTPSGSGSGPADDDLLRPREVAEIFGVAVTTVAQWARSGAMPCMLTPGGHRRYRWADVRAVFGDLDPEQEKLEEDVARLYDQGWTIRQVAEKFSLSYGVTRRILRQRTTLRSRGGSPRGESGSHGELE
jgi:transposase